MRLTAPACRGLLVLLLSLAAGLSERVIAAPSLDTTTTWSRSQQFVVISPLRPAPKRNPADNPKNDPTLEDVVRVTAADLVSTCEQVKLGVLVQLDTSDRWKGRIRLNIKPEYPARGGVFISVMPVALSDAMQSSWLYELHIPEYVERRKLVRALVQVCLLEMGNRNNTGASIDVPMWLREGLTEIILSREGSTIVAESTAIQQRVNPQFSVISPGTTKERVWTDPLEIVRAKLKGTTPLSFSDLSVPVDEQIASVGLEHFRHCAHLFTSELLALPGGSDKLRTFVQTLPRFSHPQFAFMHAFRDNFSSPLDVEKWWSLAQVNLLTKETNSRWPEKNALGKLNEILQPQVQLRLGADSLPLKETYTITKLIEEVEYEQQRPILQRTVGQLQQLEWNLPPDLLKLVYDYHVTLANYLYKRDQLSAQDKNGKTASTTARPVVKDTLKQLGFLEVLREDFARIGLSEPVSTTASGDEGNTITPNKAVEILKRSP